jgi:hypothetical protein
MGVVPFHKDRWTSMATVIATMVTAVVLRKLMVVHLVNKFLTK